MNFKQRYIFLFHEIRCLIPDPGKFWKDRKEKEKQENVTSLVFIPLVLLVGLAVFLGEILNSIEILWSYAIFRGIREIISYAFQFIITIPVLSALLKNYGGSADPKKLRRILVFTFGPFLVTSVITGLFPSLYIVSIAGLYGFYVFAMGALTLLEIPVENQSRYVILAILLIILIFGLVNILCWKIFQLIFPYGA